jgi:hypothetical protein
VVDASVLPEDVRDPRLQWTAETEHVDHVSDGAVGLTLVQHAW